MIDSGTFGYLLIDIRPVQAESQTDRPCPSVAVPGRERAGMPTALASSLRRAASTIGRATVTHGANR